MPRFTYISRDSQGQRITAMMEAESRQDLLASLKNRGLTVVEIHELNGQQAKDSKANWKRFLKLEISLGGVSTAELAIFWRQMATMIAAGLSVIEVLESIAQELEHPKFKKVLDQVVADMWEGKNFSQSLGKHDQVFSRMIVALMGAAEESGSLPDVTKQIATFIENRDRLIRKVRAALTYPIFLSVIFFGVIIFSTFWIIPRFRDLYSGFEAKLPAITEFVFSVNEVVLHYFPWIALGGFAGIIVFTLWARRPTGRAVIDRMSLRLPIFGKLLQQAAVARFCRSLAVLLFGGIPINRALEMAEETSGNTVIAKAIHEAREEILKGSKIAAGLRKQPIFPRMAVRMVSAGEESGNMTTLLEKAAEFYESRVDASLTTINTLIEPVIIVIIGGFVLIFVLSLYMPIFSLALNMKG